MNTFIEAWNQAGEQFVGSMSSMLVQSSILIALLAAADLALLRRARAAVRYGCWLVVLLKLVLPPTLTLPTSLSYWSLREHQPAPALLPSVQIGIARRSTGERPSPQATEVVPASEAVHRSASPLQERHTRPEPTAWLTALWLAGFLAMAALLVANARRTRRWLAQVEPGPDWLARMIQTEAAQLGIRGTVAGGVSPACGSPVLCGIRRPSIIIPASVLDQVDREGIRAIILHELTHLRRGDLWVGHLQAMVQAVYWWHPLVWLSNRFIRAAREQAVDDAVALAMHGRTDDYAATLVRVARLGARRVMPSFEAVGAIHSGSSLKSRVRRLLEQPLPATDRVGWRASLAIASFALVLVPMRGGPGDAKPTDDPGALQAPVAAAPTPAQNLTPRLAAIAPAANGAPAIATAPPSARPVALAARFPSIAIRIGQEKDSVRMNGQAIPVNQVSSNLTALAAANPSSVMVVSMDPSADFGTAILVLDAARQAGVTNVSLTTDGAAAEVDPRALAAPNSMAATMSAEMARRYGLVRPPVPTASPQPVALPIPARTPARDANVPHRAPIAAADPLAKPIARASATLAPATNSQFTAADQRLMKRYGLLPPNVGQLRFALEPVLLPVDSVRPIIADASLTVRSSGVEFHVIDPKQLGAVKAASRLGQTSAGTGREPNFITASGSMNLTFGQNGSEESRVGRISVQAAPGTGGARLELGITLNPSSGGANGPTPTKSDADITLPSGSSVLVALPSDANAKDGRYVLVYPIEQQPATTPATDTGNQADAQPLPAPMPRR